MTRILSEWDARDQASKLPVYFLQENGWLNLGFRSEWYLSGRSCPQPQLLDSLSIPWGPIDR